MCNMQGKAWAPQPSQGRLCGVSERYGRSQSQGGRTVEVEVDIVARGEQRAVDGDACERAAAARVAVAQRGAPAAHLQPRRFRVQGVGFRV